MANDWLKDSFRTEYEQQSEAMGRFNLAVFGKTGVGKSTLVNAIFGEDVAGVGIGEPVTQGSHLYLDKVGSLGIVDTQGLEMGTDDKKIIDELQKMINRTRKMPLSEQVHVAWYCVRGMDRRFEDTNSGSVSDAFTSLPISLKQSSEPPTKVPLNCTRSPTASAAAAANSGLRGSISVLSRSSAASVRLVAITTLGATSIPTTPRPPGLEVSTAILPIQFSIRPRGTARHSASARFGRATPRTMSFTPLLKVCRPSSTARRNASSAAGCAPIEAGTGAAFGAVWANTASLRIEMARAAAATQSERRCIRVSVPFR